MSTDISALSPEDRVLYYRQRLDDAHGYLDHLETSDDPSLTGDLSLSEQISSVKADIAQLEVDLATSYDDLSEQVAESDELTDEELEELAVALESND